MLHLLPRTIALAALLVLAGTAVAAETSSIPACAKPPNEGRILDEHQVSHPQSGHYLYVPKGQADLHKFGWWENTNHQPGLQTTECRHTTGQLIYSADRFVGILP